MKINNRIKKINKPVVAITAILVLALIVFVVFAFIIKPKTYTSSTTDNTETTQSGQQQSDNSEMNSNGKSETPNTDIPAEPTKSNTSDKKQVQMVASVDQSNNTVYIRGGVNYPVTGGSCYAQLAGPSGQSIRKDSVVLSNPGSTDCKTISISTSELASGKWTVTLNYSSEEYEGVSSEVSFSL